jgi:hypothetical protein
MTLVLRLQNSSLKALHLRAFVTGNANWNLLKAGAMYRYAMYC